MKRFFAIVVALVVAATLSGCGGTVTFHSTTPSGYLTDAQKFAVTSNVLYLERNQISAGLSDGSVATQIYGRSGVRWQGGMCFDQRRHGVLVYMCTTRQYLDPQPFGVKLVVRRMPRGFHGIVNPVYIAGPVPYSYRAPGPTIQYEYHAWRSSPGYYGYGGYGHHRYGDRDCRRHDRDRDRRYNW